MGGKMAVVGDDAVMCLTTTSKARKEVRSMELRFHSLQQMGVYMRSLFTSAINTSPDKLEKTVISAPGVRIVITHGNLVNPKDEEYAAGQD